MAKEIIILKEESKFRNCPVCSSNLIVNLHHVNNIRIVRCKACKMIFADIHPKVIEEANVYEEKEFRKYLFNEPIQTLFYYDLILMRIKKILQKERIRILEFGCGPGFFLRRAKLLGFDAVGCDISPYSELAEKYYDIKIVRSSLFDTEFEDNSFDVVISHATHEHLNNVFEISKKLYHLLTPGGLYIISGVPNYNTIQIRIFKNFTKNLPPSHVNFFQKKTLIELYRRLELLPISINTYGTSTWVWLLMIKFKSIFKSTKNKNQNQSFEKDQTLKEPQINFFHIISTYLYLYLHLPGLGRNIEMWGRK